MRSFGNCSLSHWSRPLAAPASLPNPQMGAMDSTTTTRPPPRHEAMSGPMGGGRTPTAMTAARPATPADSARAAALVVQIREALGKYRDVRVAEADGYRSSYGRCSSRLPFHSWRTRSRGVSLRSGEPDLAAVPER